MTVKEGTSTEETTVTPLEEGEAQVNVTEEEAFNASVNSLVPESKASPLEDVTEETNDSTEEEGTTEAAAEAVAEAIKPFIGDKSEEEVLEMLSKIDGMESSVFEKVSQKVFGKFGEIGQQLKALNEREFTFDPKKLTKLKEVDEGIAEALSSDLKEAFQGQQFDSEAVLSDFKQSLIGDLNPYIEERLLTALAPNATEIVKTDEFNTWFFKEAKQEVRDNFESWDKRERMDGVAMAQAFTEFAGWQEVQAKKVAAKQTNLKRAVEEPKGTSPGPAATPTMTEEEAFNTRLNEALN